MTALTEMPRGRVNVELDGSAWRTVPVAAVVAAELRVGTELDRARARILRRAMRHTGALDTAGKALSRRERSVAATHDLLARRGFTAEERDDAVHSLERLGYLDDNRFAAGRARVLAGRGYGNEAIELELEQQGVSRELIETALGSLDPELERARVAAGALEGPKAFRRLAAKGFSAETIEAAVGTIET